jgi:molybdopterin-guanine dinucleotide biosynthesis protein A
MGTDKAALVIGGTRLCDRLARLLREVADPALEVGPGWTDLATVDEGPGREGPLAAVSAAVPRLPPGAHALVVAVDMPAVTAAVLGAIAHHPFSGSVVPVDDEGHLQPLCARYSPAALAAAHALVRSGKRAMKALVDAAPSVTIGPELWPSLGEPRPFSDIDTPEDLERVRSA